MYPWAHGLICKQHIFCIAHGKHFGFGNGSTLELCDAFSYHELCGFHAFVGLDVRAQPFNISGNQVERNIAADVRAMTIRLLVEGHSDPASAKRLGVSTRTYAGYIAALKDEYGVQTRFQLGYAMGADPQGRRPTIEPQPDDDYDDGLDQPDAHSA